MQAPKWCFRRLTTALAPVVFLSGCSVIGDVIEQAFDVDEWFDDSADGVVEEGFATSWVALSLNLDARSGLPDQTFEPALESSYNAVVTVTLCDSLGVVHPVRLYFMKHEADLWEYQAVVNGAELGLDGSREVVVSQPSALRFDPDGELAAEAGGAISVSFAGADPQAITFGFITSDDSGTTQYSADTTMAHVEGDGCGGESLAAELFINSSL